MVMDKVIMRRHLVDVKEVRVDKTTGKVETIETGGMVRGLRCSMSFKARLCFL
jgi:hypothetical protein